MQPISLRLMLKEFKLIGAVAKHVGTKLRNLLLRRLVANAETKCSEQHVVIIPAADWEEFQAWCNAPAKEIPALRELAHRPCA